MNIKVVILGFVFFGTSVLFSAVAPAEPCCASLFKSSFWEAMQSKTAEEKMEMLQGVCHHHWRVEKRGDWTTTCLVENADEEENICAHKAAHEQSLEFFILLEKTYCFYETDEFYLRQNKKGNTAFHEFLFSPKMAKESVLLFLEKMYAKYESYAGSLGYLSSVQNKEGQTFRHAIALCPVLSGDEKNIWCGRFGTSGWPGFHHLKDKDGCTVSNLLWDVSDED